MSLDSAMLPLLQEDLVYFYKYGGFSLYLQSSVDGTYFVFTSQFIKISSCSCWNICWKSRVNSLLSMLTGKITALYLLFSISLGFCWGFLVYFGIPSRDISIFQREFSCGKTPNQYVLYSEKKATFFPNICFAYFPTTEGKKCYLTSILIENAAQGIDFKTHLMLMSTPK